MINYSKPFIVNTKYLFFTYLADSIDINNLDSSILMEIDTIIGVSDDGDHYIKYSYGNTYNSLTILEPHKNYLLISKKNRPNYILYNQTIYNNNSSAVILEKPISMVRYAGPSTSLYAAEWINSVGFVYGLNDNRNGFYIWSTNTQSLNYNTLTYIKNGDYYIFIKNTINAPSIST